jgi:large subunit ribosomal protein L24
MQRIKKGDTVLVIAGNDRGKKGQVHDVFPGRNKIIVSGVKMMKKHQRPTGNVKTQSGIIEREAPMSASNVLLVCKSCGEAVRTKYQVFEDGKKGRICKNCGQPAD